MTKGSGERSDKIVRMGWRIGLGLCGKDAGHGISPWFSVSYRETKLFLLFYPAGDRREIGGSELVAGKWRMDRDENLEGYGREECAGIGKPPS